MVEEKSISLDSLLAVGCDGTAVNTGTKGELDVFLCYKIRLLNIWKITF